MDELRPIIEGKVHGMIFAAACDFSKLAHDVYFNKAREFGLSEVQLWGKGEIEDMLFQPKNDHLLFAYFGISLLSRKRSLQTNIRSKLAVKRKAKRLLRIGQHILIRDAKDDRYPFLDEDEGKRRADRGRWQVAAFEGLFTDGLRFRVARSFAWLSSDGASWDYAEKMNDEALSGWQNPWDTDEEKRQIGRAEALDTWNSLPESERAFLEAVAVIPYENVIDIDEHGDEWMDGPHLYISSNASADGIFERWYLNLTAIGEDKRDGHADMQKRSSIFPRRSA